MLCHFLNAEKERIIYIINSTKEKDLLNNTEGIFKMSYHLGTHI